MTVVIQIIPLKFIPYHHKLFHHFNFQNNSNKIPSKSQTISKPNLAIIFSSFYVSWYCTFHNVHFRNSSFSLFNTESMVSLFKILDLLGLHLHALLNSENSCEEISLCVEQPHKFLAERALNRFAFQRVKEGFLQFLICHAFMLF